MSKKEIALSKEAALKEIRQIEEETILAAVAQDLYNYLNRFEISLPARKPGTINN